MRNQSDRLLLARVGVDASCLASEVPGTNVREPTSFIQEDRVRPDVANMRPEGTKIAIPIHLGVIVEIVGRLLIELLARLQALMGEGIFRHPDSGIRKP